MKKRVTRLITYTIPALIMMLFCATQQIYYHMGDDELMNDISMGNYGGGTDGHLIYINSSIGYILKPLYAMTKQINWFAVLYILVILFFSYVLLNILLKHTREYTALVVVVFVELFNIYWFTFTVISYFCICIGMIKMHELIGLNKGKTSNNRSVFLCNSIIIVILFFMSFCFRKDACLSGIVLCLPLFIFELKAFLNKKIIIMILVVAVGLISLNIINNKSYESKIWSDFQESNKARSLCYDQKIQEYKEDRKFYDSIDFTQNDIEGIRDSFFADKKIFNPKKLKKISDRIPTTKKYNFNILTYISEIKNSSLSSSIFVLTILSVLELLAIGIACTFISERKRLYFITQLIFNVGLIGVLCLIRRPVQRVLVTTVMVGIVLTIYMYTKNKTKSEHRVKRIIELSIVLVLLFSSALYGWKTVTNAQYFSNYHTKQKKVREYTDNNKDKLFLVHRRWEWLYYKPVMNIDGNNTCNNIIQTGDQDTYSKPYYKQLKGFSINNNRLLAELIKNDQVYLLVDQDTDTKFLRMVKKYYLEHHNENVRLKTIKHFNNSNIYIYKCVRK